MHCTEEKLLKYNIFASNCLHRWKAVFFLYNSDLISHHGISPLASLSDEWFDLWEDARNDRKKDSTQY